MKNNRNGIVKCVVFRHYAVVIVVAYVKLSLSIVCSDLLINMYMYSVVTKVEIKDRLRKISNTIHVPNRF